MLQSSSLHCCGFCKPGALSLWGQLCITCLSRRSGFTGLRRFFRLHLQMRNCSEDQHRGAPCGQPAGHFFLTVLLRCHTPSGTFLYCWPLIFPSIYCRKALRGVLCFARRVFISRKLLASMLEDCWGEGGTCLLLIFLYSFILHACTEVTFYCQF